MITTPDRESSPAKNAVSMEISPEPMHEKEPEEEVKAPEQVIVP